MSYENGKRLTSAEVNNFVKIRENYFNYLKKVISDNCKKCWNARVSENILEQLSLSLEQPALLACLKREIYQLLMRETILKIKRLTGEGVLDLELKMMLEKIDKESKNTQFEFLKDFSADPALDKGDELEGKLFPRTPDSDNGRNDFFHSKSDQDDVRADIIDILENDESRYSTVASDRNNLLKNDQKRNEKKILKSKSKETVWKHERIIQTHNMFLLISRKSEEERLKNEMMFLDLFGEDITSDADADADADEEECRDEIYRRSCSERISALVVKHLMPYYRENRILGRMVFKRLGCFISEQILQVVEYPDEVYVKYFVAKFFRKKKVYRSETDVPHGKYI